MRKLFIAAAGAALAGALVSMPAQAFWGSWGNGPWYGGPWHGGPWYGGGYPYYGGWGGYPYGYGYGYGYPGYGGWGGPWGYGAPYYGYATPYAAPAPQAPAASDNER